MRQRLGAFAAVAAIGCVVVATALLPIQTVAGAAKPDLRAWQQAIKHLGVPGKGCFTSSYPTIQWKAVRCTDRPEQIPQVGANTGNGAAQGPSPQAVGGGNDYMAQVLGSMSSATGSIPSVTCSSSPGCSVTETGSDGHMGPGGTQTSNVFSLQLNTNGNITTPECSIPSTPGGPGCTGWIQFIYDSVTNQIDMEPALADFGAGTCPTGFGASSGTGSGRFCYDLGLPKMTVPGGVTIADLPNVSLTGSVAPGGIYTVVLTNSGTATAVVDQSPIDATGQWTNTEFGIFGDRGGSQALFSPDTTIVVQTNTNSNTPEPPTCPSAFGVITLETNSLNLVTTPQSLAGSSPGIVSEQSNVLTSAPSCVTSPAPIPTTTTLSSSPNPSTFGQPVTLTASVSPTDGLGTVAFDADGSPVSGCSAQGLALVAGTYQATCVTSTLAPGTHSITATYSGDDSYAGSPGSLAGGQVVDQILTTTIVNSSPDPSIFGQPVTLTAFETPSDGGGTVAFYADGSANPISGCGAQSLSLVAGNWQATCVTSSLPVGTDPITTTYTGDTDYAGSLGSLAGGQVVDRIPTTTTLASSVNPSIHHQPVTFTATVTPTDGSGTVAFDNGSTVISGCGAKPLSLVGIKYQATCTVSSLAVGTDVITATYSGDTDYLRSTSAALSQNVKAHGAPAFVTPVSGTPQSSPAGSEFALPLKVKVTDLWGNAVPLVVVNFTAPFTGPSATFPGGLPFDVAATSSNGQATVFLTANSTVGGPYDVVASVGALSGDFVLTNLQPLPDISILSYGTDLIVNGQPQSVLLNSVYNTTSVPTAGKLTVTDYLPPGINFTGKDIGPGWGCKYEPTNGVADEVAICTTTDSIPVGGLSELSLYVDVTAPAGTVLTIYTNVAPTDITPNDNTDIIQVVAGTF